jgi:DoxX-like family
MAAREGLMTNVLIATRFAWTIASIFGVSGLLHVTGLGFVKRAYARADFPPHFYRMAGFVQLIAALFLASPFTRIWGVILAASVTFAAIVVLLSNRHYVYSVPGLLLLAALIPASLAGPV